MRTEFHTNSYICLDWLAGHNLRRIVNQISMQIGSNGPFDHEEQQIMGQLAEATEMPCECIASAGIVLQQTLNPKIRAFIEYWQSISPPGLLPGRQHFKPMEIPTLLSNLWLIDVEQTPRLRFRYRLIGTSVARAFSKDQTGRYLDEVHPSFASSPVSKYLIEVVQKAKPSWRIGKPAFWELHEFLRLERIYLPAARDGVNIDMIFALTVFLDRFGEEH